MAGSKPRHSLATYSLDIPGGLSEIAQLDALRRGLGCSQLQLARMIGVSQSSLSRLFHLPTMARRGAHFLATHEGLSRIELALKVFATTIPAERLRRRTLPVPKKPVIWYDLFPDVSTVAKTATGKGPELQMSSATDSGVTRATGARRTTYRLLIAEDDLETAALYTTLFTEEELRLRYEVTVATTVDDCLQHLRSTWKSQPYDLLVMDLGLGDRWGEASESLLSQLRRRPQLVPPQLLVVSGISPYHLRAKVADLAELHATFIAKPFDIDQVLDSVYELVTGNTEASGYLRLL